MASLEFDKSSRSYRIRFRFAGRAFKRSLSTDNRKLANSTLARVEETLALIANDRLEVPDDVDPAEFIVSDGKRSRPFRTWDEIAPIFARGSITSAEERELWESLYLTRDEVHEALSYAKKHAGNPFIYPLLVSWLTQEYE